MLFTLDKLSNEEIIKIVKKACNFDFKNRDSAKNKNLVVAILFFEPSTRTRFSFEIAAKRLGMQTITLVEGKNSSIAKGESIYDTTKTFENIGADGIIIRHPHKEYYKTLQDIKVPIISGGDGDGNHPTQSLLDLVTIYKEFGKFKGLKVAIFGDIKHSRVAHTNMAIMKRLGMGVEVVCPKQLTLQGQKAIDANEAIANADVLMALRVQLERHSAKFKMSARFYNKKFGLNKNNIKNKKPNAIIMHPGPVNWGIELSEDLINHPDSRINEQVKNGVLLRAVLLEKYILCK